MSLPVQSVTPVLAAQPGWLAEAAFWLGAIAVLVGVAIGAGVWTLVLRLREVRRASEPLRSLEELKLRLDRLVTDRDDLDLRRIEHLLIDLRDGQGRLEDALLRFVEAAREGGAASTELAPHLGQDLLGERVTNRLLALGYERIQIVTRSEKMLELAQNDGEILVEARRNGVLHKGRVLVRGGSLTEVEIHPAYSIFP
jgi:hypothetical protein